MLTGSIVALVTPMHENGEVAWDALDELIEWQVASGTQGIVPMGTTGESATLDTQEQSITARIVVVITDIFLMMVLNQQVKDIVIMDFV